MMSGKYSAVFSLIMSLIGFILAAFKYAAKQEQIALLYIIAAILWSILAELERKRD